MFLGKLCESESKSDLISNTLLRKSHLSSSNIRNETQNVSHEDIYTYITTKDLYKRIDFMHFLKFKTGYVKIRDDTMNASHE